MTNDEHFKCVNGQTIAIINASRITLLGFYYMHVMTTRLRCVELMNYYC